jgi:superfamily I DNA/RNA helicase
VVPLVEYTGESVERVKVGTFHRAKGLEFAWVFVPDRDRYPRVRSPRVSAEAYHEQAELERRILFVAMTRARDGLWLGVGENPIRRSADGPDHRHRGHDRANSGMGTSSKLTR